MFYQVGAVMPHCIFQHSSSSFLLLQLIVDAAERKRLCTAMLTMLYDT
jgi:hypothetical protein